MKNKILTVLGVCGFIIFGVCYAAYSNTTKDGLTRTERQTLTYFFQKMETCQNAQFTSKAVNYKSYKSGAYCIFETYNPNTQEKDKCEFPLSVVKSFAKSNIELNEKILNNTLPNNMLEDKSFIESLTLTGKYCNK